MVFEHTIGEKDGFRLITISGRLTDKEQSLALISTFETMIINGETRFLLEMSDLEYVNSSGLNLLIGMFTKARNAGGELAICAGF
jgi:anti-anti-sigma factor